MFFRHFFLIAPKKPKSPTDLHNGCIANFWAKEETRLSRQITAAAVAAAVSTSTWPILNFNFFIFEGASSRFFLPWLYSFLLYYVFSPFFPPPSLIVALLRWLSLGWLYFHNEKQKRHMKGKRRRTWDPRLVRLLAE